MVALELSGVSKRYGQRHALRNVDWSVPRGTTVGILGPNGAGKTTLLRLALGFTRPSAGRIRLQGEDPGKPAARRGLGHLPERVALPQSATVDAVLRLHARLLGLSGAERERAIGAVLEQTGLVERRRDRCGGLSKGLAQRVGFARALLGDPDLVLLDEPTSGLDPIGVRDARDWIHAAGERGATVLVCSHVLSEVERVCDQVAILHEGEIAAAGTLAEVVAEGETLEDAFVRWVRS